MQPPKDSSIHWDEEDEYDLLVKGTESGLNNSPVARRRTEPTTSEKGTEPGFNNRYVTGRRKESTTSERETEPGFNNGPVTRRRTEPTNFAPSPVPKRRSLPDKPAKNLLINNAPKPVHWLLPVGIGMLAMAALWVLGTDIVSWTPRVMSDFDKSHISMSPLLIGLLIIGFIIIAIIVSVILLTSKRSKKLDRPITPTSQAYLKDTTKNQPDLDDTTLIYADSYEKYDDAYYTASFHNTMRRYLSAKGDTTNPINKTQSPTEDSDKKMRRSISGPSPENISLQEGQNTLIYIHIRIVEEPVYAMNFATILSAFVELHTKSWLISQNRLGDLIEYTQTHNPHFVEEAGLIIEKITHNSPPDIKFNLELSPTSVSEALKAGIDAIVQAPLRKEETMLGNQAKMLDMKIKELEADSEHASSTQTLQIEAQRADLEKQKTLLEIEKQQVEIEKQRLELQEMRLEIERKRIDYALDAASKMVTVLRSDADAETRDMLMRTLLPNLLQLGNSTGLEITLATAEPKSKPTI